LRTHQLAFAADAVAVIEQFDRRSLCARRQTGGTDRLEREPKASGGRQSLLQVQRKAIGRNHIEANAWEHHDAARFCLCVPRLNGLVNGDLAGNIEIVSADAQAGFDERHGGVLEWPGAVQHDCNCVKPAVDGGGIVETEGAPLKAGPTGETVEFSGVPSGDDRLYAQAARCTCDMLADVTVGPVDH
jgi:hypothetical protein